MNFTPPSGYASDTLTPEDAHFAHDRFIIRQWVRAIVNKYEVRVAADDSAKPAEGNLIAFVHQKMMKLKEQIPFYADKERTREIMHLQARKILEARGRYDVTAPDGSKIGELHKQFKQSLLRSTWKVYNAEGHEVVMMQEKSVPLAIWRRFCGIVPYLGAWLAAIPIPYGFNLHAGEQLFLADASLSPGTLIGTHTRRIGIRDIYDLDLRADPTRAFDRRLAIAAAIGLDCLQRR